MTPSRLPIRCIAVAALVAAVATGCNRRDVDDTIVPDADPSITNPAAVPAPTVPLGTEPEPVAVVPVQTAYVSGVELGTGVGPDGRITQPATTFAPDDTIHVVVATQGVPAGTALGANWLYEGATAGTPPTGAPEAQVVHTETKTIGGDGQAMHAFHVDKPDGWPVGRYRAEITVDGVPVQTRGFEVR